MKFIIAICTLAVISVVQGYDFSDPGFNALLTQEYSDYMNDDYDSAPLNYRAKRETPECQPMMRPRELPSQRCCKVAIEKPDSFDKIKDLKKTCFGEVKGNRTEHESEFEMFSCDRIEKKREEMRCAYECIAKKQKIFGEENNKFDEMTTIELFRNEFVDLPWVKDNLEVIVSGCIAETTKLDAVTPVPTVAIETARGSADDEVKCSEKPMKFLFCLWREFTKKCPVDQQKDSRSCKLIREGKLEYVHHGHEHGHHGHHHHHH